MRGAIRYPLYELQRPGAAYNTFLQHIHPPSLLTGEGRVRGGSSVYPLNFPKVWSKGATCSPALLVLKNRKLKAGGVGGVGKSQAPRSRPFTCAIDSVPGVPDIKGRLLSQTALYLENVFVPIGSQGWVENDQEALGDRLALGA
ncbi:hypothetical protein SKAU_G00139060 [Synaphobranchus kaupii]|uniref:Uncharacterized protein n=1 Tax=Synaphobranchus kaupii TaxID=118154 RepID=A0A9Q1J491_SYNKA|nr:hypothetical protein SKAU_G00139060 [Synaphobranchus kaupii]